jgi:alpha-tubulin suppressor-like RCC1 family protein
MQVACGHAHSAFVSKDGEVWCWGMGLYGELGQDSRLDHWLPQVLIGPNRALIDPYATSLYGELGQDSRLDHWFPQVVREP